MSDTVRQNIADGIFTITMNRPKHLNALNWEMLNGLRQAVEFVLERPDEVRCIVIEGAGKHFMAGGDIVYFQSLMDKSAEEKRHKFNDLISSLHQFVTSLAEVPVPVVAKVRGAAAGFGISLVAGCDMAFASQGAFFTSAYNILGTTPDGGSTYYLPRTVSMKKAMEVVLLTHRYSAPEALQMGLVNQVVDESALDEQVAKSVLQISQSAKTAVRNTKKLIRSSYNNNLNDQLALELECFLESAVTGDFSEGVNAFVDKRKPNFT